MRLASAAECNHLSPRNSILVAGQRVADTLPFFLPCTHAGPRAAYAGFGEGAPARYNRPMVAPLPGPHGVHTAPPTTVATGGTLPTEGDLPERLATPARLATPLRIGVLTHNYPRFSGDFSGTFVEALCRELAGRGHELTLWTPHDAEWQRAPVEERGAGRIRLRPYRYAWPARVQQLGYMRSMQADLALRLNAYLLSPLLFGAGIAAVLRDCLLERPQLLHAHWVLPSGFIAAVVSRLLGIPLVVSVPGSDAQVAGANPLFRAMARAVFRQAALLTANSAELRDAVVALGADPARFDLILYGTDPDELRPEATAVALLREAWKEKLGLAPVMEPVVVLAVGRLVPKKGFDVLIRALAEEALRAPSLHEQPVVAVIVGSGEEGPALRRLAEELGVAQRVLWAGRVPKTEIGRWYSAADLLAMPSVSRPADGLNVCVLDAMSCARPVVASNVAGNPLAVTHGVTGFIVPEQDAGALADAIATLATQPALRDAMGAAARRRMEAELGWPALATRYLDHFERLANPR
jgi:glycosyltransferase involved in cell wall biosynthesis